MLVPLLWFPCSSELQVGQVSGTALPLTSSVAGTQGHSVITELKLRGRERKRLSSVCCWGPWHTSWGLCSRQGPFGMKEQQGGLLATGQRHPEIMYKGGGAPAWPPRAKLAHGDRVQ